MRIVLTHGRDQAYQVPATMQRAWADALRHGLKSAGMPDPDSVPIGFAFYGDIWRPDRRELADADRGDEPGERTLEAELGDAPATDLQQALADDLLGPPSDDEERLDWGALVSVVRVLDARLDVGGFILTQFLKDLDEYFRDPEIRERTLDAVRAALRAEPGPVVLLGHSMGSIVSYDLLATDGAADLDVAALVTFGSPLGMRSMRAQMERLHPGTPFPSGLRAWTNVYNSEDFATAIPQLTELYRRDGGPAILDVPALGAPPSIGQPGRGHDPIIYLSSIGLAGPVARLLRPMAAANGGGGGGAQRLPVGLPEDEGERGFEALPADDGERGEEVPAVVADGDAQAAPGMRVVDRTASADFPPSVLPGSMHELRFAIAEQAVYAVSERIRISAPVDQRVVTLRVGIQAPDFDVVPTDAPDQIRSYADLDIDLTDAKQIAEARFRLTARTVDVATASTIYLTIYRGNLPLGQLYLQTTIDPAFKPSLASIGLDLSGTRPKDPDYVLVVTDRSVGMKGSGPFDLSVSKEGPGGYLNRPLGLLEVALGAKAYASERLQRFRKIRENPDPDERIRAAQRLGVLLWGDLPADFQRFYWEELTGHPGASIAIYSQEPYVPWELVRPQRETGEEDDFLGITFSMARWKAAIRFPDPLEVTRFDIIAPDYPPGGPRPLPGAQVEAQEIVRLFGATPVAADLKSVRNLLESTEGVQIIHFAGHGDFDDAAADASVIKLVDGNLTPGDLTLATLGKAAHPLVFLNACEVGDRGWTLTQIGGWADAFTDRAFSGFVGPYWAVTDRVARKAATLFYGSLSSGKTIGEAIREVRSRFYTDDEDRGHPSWLAYTLHCQPTIHVRMPKVEAAAAGVPAAAPEGGG